MKMLFKKTEKNADVFWKEYEEKIGEKISAYSLGKYLSGWEEFDSRNWGGLWGLMVASKGGFRFHHFPQSHWLDFVSRAEGVKEKFFFIPGENIISAEIVKEKQWWKRIFSSPSPVLKIRFKDDSNNESDLLLEADLISNDFILGEPFAKLS